RLHEKAKRRGDFGDFEGMHLRKLRHIAALLALLLATGCGGQAENQPTETGAEGMTTYYTADTPFRMSSPTRPSETMAD
ncbi:MAG: hypothetical protein IJ792_01680, partial [Oscillospiraceae bacterium]|nr:hypothetical protein [Oscillospiraceae bacterium]